MTREEINKLIATGDFSVPCIDPVLVETHISWVIICSAFVFKIKKPIHYSFLDFSTPVLRRHFCEREIELNRRLAGDMYLEVVQVREASGKPSIGHPDGEIIDYAVKMRRMDRERQMDVLLRSRSVGKANVVQLARQIADFHKKTEVILDKDILDVQEKFNDLAEERDFLTESLGHWSREYIDRSVDQSDAFLSTNEELLSMRLEEGFVRDCHGDLHSRNIFLLPMPVIFDCIEFNDDYRQIDVLNEVAFLCMDLEAFGREDLSSVFVAAYNELLPAIRNEKERCLFTYYKGYRANVRAKVNSLRAREPEQRKKALSETEKYLRLMQSYMDGLA